MAQKTFLIDPAIYEYCQQHSVEEPEVLERLRAETATSPRARMQIAPEQGKLFAILIQAIGAKRALEVGVFTGYSSTAVALALPADGELVACDISEEYTAVAQRYWRDAGVRDKIELRLGPAAESLRALIQEGQEGTFDFAFIDADKTGYREYFELCLRLVRSGGLIVLDNMLYHGEMLEADPKDVNAAALRELNRFIAEDGRVMSALLPIADGVTLAVKL